MSTATSRDPASVGVPRIAVVGALGRMGRRALACSEEAGCAVAAVLTHADDPRIGRTLADLGIVSSGHALAARTVACDFPPPDQLDVVLDLSSPAGLTHAAAYCAAKRLPLVSGTTGLDATAEAALDQAARVVAVLHATNFSLGVALLNELVRLATRALGPTADVEIVEHHHRTKADSPSGTARTLAQTIAAVRGVHLDAALTHGRGGNGQAARIGDRPVGQIGMHAVRGGDVIGEHAVQFFVPGERLELTHRASSRDVFVRGALTACRWIAANGQGKPPGRYQIHDVVLGS